MGLLGVTFVTSSTLNALNSTVKALSFLNRKVPELVLQLSL